MPTARGESVAKVEMVYHFVNANHRTVPSVSIRIRHADGVGAAIRSAGVVKSGPLRAMDVSVP